MWIRDASATELRGRDVDQLYRRVRSTTGVKNAEIRTHPNFFEVPLEGVWDRFGGFCKLVAKQVKN